MNIQLESELEWALRDTLEKQTGLVGTDLYRYLVLRSRVDTIQKGRSKQIKWDDRQVARFLLKEWGLNEGDSISFQGTRFVLTFYGELGVHRIISDWREECAYRFDKGQLERELDREFQLYSKEAKLKVKKWSKEPFYELALKDAFLERLNDAYQITNRHELMPIEGISSDSHNEGMRLELTLKRLLHPFRQQDHHQLKEQDIEAYLATHLHEVEEGLRLIGQQVVLPHGRIDLLARDKKGRNVVIEVKVATDTDLTWQQAYYTKEVRERYGGETRFLVVAPEWEPHIMDELLKTEGTEVYLFQAHVQQSRLIELALTRHKAS